MFLIVLHEIFLNHVFTYLFIISRLDLVFYFFTYCKAPLGEMEMALHKFCNYYYCHYYYSGQNILGWVN